MYQIARIIMLVFLPFLGVSQKESKPIVESSLIFPEQDKHVHGSSLVALPNGDFLAVWFYGSGERQADDVKLMGARLQKGSRVWGEPFQMADTPNIPDCNPVLFLNQQAKLFLVWIAVQSNRWEQSILRVKTSTNYTYSGAPVWEWQDNILLKMDDQFAKEIDTKLKELPSHQIGWAGYAPKYDEQIRAASMDPMKRNIGWMTRIKPLLIDENRIVLPLYSDGFNLSLMAISDDQGNSWHPSMPVVGRGPIQPALIRKKNGNIMAFMRDSGDEPSRVHVSESSDLGEHWTPTIKTDIPNTASVELLVLRDGRLAFLGNDLPNGRNRLQLYISDDEGKSWKWKFPIENHEPGKGSFSYPSLSQTKDGMLHMTYSSHLANNKKSIKYVVVDPSKIQ